MTYLLYTYISLFKFKNWVFKEQYYQFFPTFSVLDKGCGLILIVLIIIFCGWVPGLIADMVILNNPKK